MAVGFVASATSGSQASVASFNIGTLGTGARAGVVFVATHNSATAVDTAVTWNGVSMTLLYSATDTNTEPGVVRAYFLDNVSNGTITVTRTNDATVCVGYAASISAAGLTFVSQVKTIGGGGTVQTNADASEAGTAASGEVAVDDGSPGTNSMRFSAFFSGAATPPSQGTNSTALQVLDSTAFGSRFVRETTAGQGSRSVGAATGTTDDWALVALAVSEAVNPSGTGAVTTAAATVAGTGSEVFTATGAATLAAATIAGTGAEVFTATGAATLAATTVVGVGEEVFTATGAASLAATTVAGSGDHTGGEVSPEGTGAVSLAATTVAGDGELGLTATGAATLAAMTTSGTGALVLTGSGAVVLSSATVAGDGVGGISGTGDILMAGISTSGAGTSTGGIDPGGSGGRKGPILRRRARIPAENEDDLLYDFPFEVF